MIILVTATYQSVLPLTYYNNLLSEFIVNKDEGLAEYISAANQFFNNEVQDPAMSNKHNSWTLTMKSMVSQSEQVRSTVERDQSEMSLFRKKLPQ